MRRNSNVWRILSESTEGPTVTLTIPRDMAEALINILSPAVNDGEGEGGDQDDDILPDMDGGPDDLEALDGGPPTADLEPERRGPGRPPGSKNKPKSDDDGPDDDDEDDEKKGKEKVGESAFHTIAKSFLLTGRRR